MSVVDQGNIFDEPPNLITAVKVFGQVTEVTMVSVQTVHGGNQCMYNVNHIQHHVIAPALCHNKGSNMSATHLT